jgi:hypothetical protein
LLLRLRNQDRRGLDVQTHLDGSTTLRPVGWNKASLSMHLLASLAGLTDELVCELREEQQQWRNAARVRCARRLANPGAQTRQLGHRFLGPPWPEPEMTDGPIDLPPP